MPKTTKKETTGTDFVNQQKDIHNALNDTRKEALGQDKLDPERNQKSDYKPGVDEKKTGQTSHN